MPYEVQLKEVPDLLVASVRRRASMGRSRRSSSRSGSVGPPPSGAQVVESAIHAR